MPTFDLPGVNNLPKTGTVVPNSFTAAKLKGGPVSAFTHDPVSVPSNWNITPKKDEEGKNIEGQIIATCIRNPTLVFEGTPNEFSEYLRQLASQ